MNRVVLILLLVALSVVPAWAQSKPVLGIDYVPVIVKDLVRARADFRALGFTSQVGAAQQNAVRDEHVRFADGSEIQLVSPTAAMDQLSAQYLSWLEQGDGAASVGLFRPGARPSPAEGVFFGERAGKPAGKADPLEHPNGAVSLSAVWLAGSPAEKKILGFPGGRLVGGAFCTPIGSSSRAVQFKQGQIVLLPAAAQIVRGRPVVAVTVTVEKLVLTQGFLAGARVPFRQEAGCGRPSLWVQTHNLWLEFRER